MANINLEKLIDLELLSYYDEKIKKWILAMAGSGNTKFVTDGELPEKGESGVLYVTEDSIKYWDDEKEEYVDVGKGSAEEPEGSLGSWGTF